MISAPIRWYVGNPVAPSYNDTTRRHFYEPKSGYTTDTEFALSLDPQAPGMIGNMYLLFTSHPVNNILS